MNARDSRNEPLSDCCQEMLLCPVLVFAAQFLAGPVSCLHWSKKCSARRLPKRRKHWGDIQEVFNKGRMFCFRRSAKDCRIGSCHIEQNQADTLGPCCNSRDSLWNFWAYGNVQESSAWHAGLTDTNTIKAFVPLERRRPTTIKSWKLTTVHTGHTGSVWSTSGLWTSFPIPSCLFFLLASFSKFSVSQLEATIWYLRFDEFVKMVCHLVTEVTFL